MSFYTVHKGKHYKAMISLNWWEQVASNDMIAAKLSDAGFTDVTVTGEGPMREAVGLWPHNDATAQVPSQVIAVREIETQVASR